jgi:hypothetical protein
VSRAALLQGALAAAVRAKGAAEADCPHWDWSGLQYVGACCDRLHDAEQRVYRLRKALRRARIVDAARAGDADAYHVLTRG